MQGRSVLPLLRGRETEWPQEVFVQISESQVARAVRTRRWKYCVSAPGKDARKAPASDQYVEESLYDLEHDPHELVNLIQMASHRPVAEVMRQRLLRRMAEAGESPAEIVSAPVKKSGQRRVRPEETQM